MIFAHWEEPRCILIRLRTIIHGVRPRIGPVSTAANGMPARAANCSSMPPACPTYKRSTAPSGSHHSASRSAFCSRSDGRVSVSWPSGDTLGCARPSPSGRCNGLSGWAGSGRWTFRDCSGWLRSGCAGASRSSARPSCSDEAASAGGSSVPNPCALSWSSLCRLARLGSLSSGFRRFWSYCCGLTCHRQDGIHVAAGTATETGVAYAAFFSGHLPRNAQQETDPSHARKQR